jgi:hypothetical protein
MVLSGRIIPLYSSNAKADLSLFEQMTTDVFLRSIMPFLDLYDAASLVRTTRIGHFPFTVAVACALPTFVMDMRSKVAVAGDLTRLVAKLTPATSTRTTTLKIDSFDSLFPGCELGGLLSAFPKATDIEINNKENHGAFGDDVLWKQPSLLRLYVSGAVQMPHLIDVQYDLAQHSRLVECSLPDLEIESIGACRALLRHAFAANLQRLEFRWDVPQERPHERVEILREISKQCPRLKFLRLNSGSHLGSLTEFYNNVLVLPRLEHLSLGVFSTNEYNRAPDFTWLQAYPHLTELRLPGESFKDHHGINRTPSPDDSKKSLERFLQTHPRLRVLVLDKWPESWLVSTVGTYCADMEVLAYMPKGMERWAVSEPYDVKAMAVALQAMPRLRQWGTLHGEVRAVVWPLLRLLPHTRHVKATVSSRIGRPYSSASDEERARDQLKYEADIVLLAKPEDWEPLDGLRALRVLYLQESQRHNMDRVHIHDARLQTWSRVHTHLRFLSFDGGGSMSDAGLQALARGCPHLRVVDIEMFGKDADPSQLSWPTLQTLVQHCPKLEYCSLMAKWQPDVAGWSDRLTAFVSPKRLYMVIRGHEFRILLEWGTRHRSTTNIHHMASSFL